MNSALLAFGLLTLSVSTSDSQANRFGGLYLFEGDRFTYPNGESWGPYKEHVFFPVVGGTQTLMYVPGVKNPMTGMVSANFVSARGPVFGANFAKAPATIQRKIGEKNLEQSFSIAIEDGEARLRGVLDLYYANWSGDELKDVTRFEHNIKLTRVECQVKTLEFKVEGFDQVFAEREPERARELADAERSVKDSRGAFSDSQAIVKKTSDDVGPIVKAAADNRKAIVDAIGEMDRAGAGLANAEHRKLVGEIAQLEARQKQIQDRLAVIRRDMPSTPASVIRSLQSESALNQQKLGAKRQQQVRLEQRLGIEAERVKARGKVEQQELALVQRLRDLDQAKIVRDAAAADAVQKFEFYLERIQDLKARTMSRKFEPSLALPALDKVNVESGGIVFEARPDHPFEVLSAVGKRIQAATRSMDRINESLRVYRQDFQELRRLMLNDAEAMVKGPLSSARAENPTKVNQTNNEIVAACLTNTVNELSNFLADELQKTGLVAATEWDEFFSYRVMSPGANDIYAAELASTVFLRRRGRDQIQWDFLAKLSELMASDQRASQMNLKTGLAEAAFGKSNETVLSRWRVFVQGSNASLELPWKRGLIDSLKPGSSAEVAMTEQDGATRTRIDHLMKMRERYRQQLDERTFKGISDLAMEKVNAFVAPTNSTADGQRRTIWARMLKNGARAKAVGLVIQRLQQARWEVLSEIRHYVDVETRIAEAMEPHSLKVVSAPKFFATTTPIVKLSFARTGYLPDVSRVECSINRTVMKGDGLSFVYPSTPEGYQALSDDWRLSVSIKARP